MRTKRWRLQDPISVGFLGLIHAERRMVRSRVWKARARFLGEMALVVVGLVGSLVGTLALFIWMQGAA